MSIKGIEVIRLGNYVYSMFKPWIAFYFSNNFVVIAPNVIHYDEDETVLVTIEGKQANPTVELYLQDYPDRMNTFSKLQNKRVKPGKEAYFVARLIKGQSLNNVCHS